jgi:hypothetical protein
MRESVEPWARTSKYCSAHLEHTVILCLAVAHVHEARVSEEG